MFEKEEELTTTDDKSGRYSRLYRKKRMEYQRKPLVIPSLEVWPQKKCNLRCQHCVRLVPYAQEKEMYVAKTIRDLERVFLCASVQHLLIGGGNPFLCEGLGELIHFCAEEPKAGEICVRVNGTTLPDDDVTEELRRCGGRARVVIDRYRATTDEADRLYAYLAEKNILCTMRDLFEPGEGEWKKTGGPFQQYLHFETARFVYADCILKGQLTLADGLLTACPRGIHARTVFSLEENPWEYVRADSLADDARSRARLAVCMDTTLYKDYCQHCLGLSEENPYTVLPGEQYAEAFERIQEKMQ